MHAFERTIQQHPGYAPAYRDIEYLVMEQDAGMLPEAVEMLENLSERSQEGALFQSLGNLYFHDRQEDQAISSWHEAKERYRQALERGDQNGWNALGLAAVLYYLGEDPDQMAEMLGAAEQVGLREDIRRLLEELGWLLVQIEDCGNASRIFSEIQDRYPDYIVPAELRERCP